MPEAAYADDAAYADWIAPETAPATGDLDPVLRRASEDLDVLLGDYEVISTGTYMGRKIDPTTLQYEDARALARATCAQAEYRFKMGEDFFTVPPLKNTSGPDFTTQQKRSFIAPKAMRELSGTGLVRATTTIAHHPRVPPWLSFAYNIEPAEGEYGGLNPGARR